MTTCVVLLRGVNVGGHHRVPMADLRSLLAGLGGEDVQTYVQSGNAVLTWAGTTAALEAAVGTALTAALGFTVPVMARTAGALRGNNRMAQPLAGLSRLKDLPEVLEQERVRGDSPP